MNNRPTSKKSRPAGRGKETLRKIVVKKKREGTDNSVFSSLPGEIVFRYEFSSSAVFFFVLLIEKYCQDSSFCGRCSTTSVLFGL